MQPSKNGWEIATIVLLPFTLLGLITIWGVYTNNLECSETQKGGITFSFWMIALPLAVFGLFLLSRSLYNYFKENKK